MLENYECLEVSRSNKVLTIDFNRPKSLNAFNQKMHSEFAKVLQQIPDGNEINAIVITGKGKTFSVGGDVKWFNDMSTDQLDNLFYEAKIIVSRMLEIKQPIISSINGTALGLGATIALFSDIILMSENASIGDPHVNIGIVAGDGGAAIWPWLVGAARAKEFLMTGRMVGAYEAKELGLVNHVYSPSDLEEKTYELAIKLAEGPTKAIRGTKLSINKILKDTVNLVLDTSIALEKESFRSLDHIEAVNAFMEKRSPIFTGD